MTRRCVATTLVLTAVLTAWSCFAQTARTNEAGPVKTLTLAEAEQIAIRNHPRLSSAKFLAGAAQAVIVETKSAYYPVLSGAVTGAQAERGTTLAAGNLTTSSLFSRFAAGLYLNQLVTDFGRTGNLVQSAELRADAQNRNVDLTRAQIRVRVQQAYFRALQAQSVLGVTEQTLESRRLTLRRVRALAESQLKSTLDVSFADVTVSEAELALFRAENDQRASRSELAAALGSPSDIVFNLAEEPLPGALNRDVNSLISEAMSQRPDLAGLRLTRDAAGRFAEAERKLRLPTVNLLGAAGALPARDDRLRGNYSAGAINLTIPVFNGHAFSARYSEAEQRAQAAAKDTQDLEIQVSRDVRIAWLNAETAFRRLDLTAKLVDQAAQALRLAQARYDLGLSSIVELSQAELSNTGAAIENAAAKYDYQIQRAVLDYVIGALK